MQIAHLEAAPVCLLVNTRASRSDAADFTPGVIHPASVSLAPMLVFPVGELPDVVPVKRPHDADPGEHRRAATGHQHQGLHRVLPLRRAVLRFGKLRDVVAGVLQGNELVAQGRSIGSSNSRDQSVGALPTNRRLDRLAQPLHRELIIPRLQMATAFNLGLISMLRVPREILSSDPARFAMLSGELVSDEGVARHGP
jgi:hypothetical protein